MRINNKAKQETEKRILDAAERLFTTHGFGETTTRDIAVEADIAVGTLFNYFPTKEALALRLVADAAEKAGQEPSATGESSALDFGTLEEALLAHVAAELRYLRPFRGFVRNVLERSLSPFVAGDGEGDQATAFRINHIETLRRLTVVYRASPPPGPSALTLHLYWTLYLGVLAFWAADNSPNQEDTLALLDQSIRLFVASLRTQVLDTETSYVT
ncbi:MAG: TetR family transcriptional regulator [Phycisphaerae bacterium]